MEFLGLNRFSIVWQLDVISGQFVWHFTFCTPVPTPHTLTHTHTSTLHAPHATHKKSWQKKQQQRKSRKKLHTNRAQQLHLAKFQTIQFIWLNENPIWVLLSRALLLSLSCCASLTCCGDAYQCRSQIIFAFPNSLFRFVCALGLAALVCVRHVAEHERPKERERERVCGVSQQTSFVACGASFALRYFLPVEPSTLTCLDVFMDKAISMSCCWKYKQDSNNNNHNNTRNNNITKTKHAKYKSKSQSKPKLKNTNWTVNFVSVPTRSCTSSSPASARPPLPCICTDLAVNSFRNVCVCAKKRLKNQLKILMKLFARFMNGFF